MNSPHSAEDTISRYLDGALTPEEAAAFSATLAADPETALTFARMARTDSLLAAAFPLRPRRRLFKPLAFTAAAAAVIAAGFFALPRLFPGESSRLPQTARLSDTGSDHHSMPAGGKRRTVKPAAPAALMAKPLSEHFAFFTVTADPQGLTVPQALAALEQNIRELNLLGRPELNGLRFSAGNSSIPGASKPVIASPVLPPVSISTYLGICACYDRIYLEPEHVLYAPKEARKVDIMPDSRRYRVRPDFLSAWYARHPVSRPADDPFAPSPPLTFPPIEAVVRNYFGITAMLEEDTPLYEHLAHFRYSPAEGVLEVEQAPVFELEHISRLLEMTNSPGASRQYFLSTKFARFAPGTQPPGLTDERGILLTDEKLQAVCREVAGTKGGLLSLPSIVQRQAQRSKVELTYEVPLSIPESDKTTFDWVGYQVEMEARAAGEFIYIRGSIDVGMPAGQDASALDKWGADLAPVAKEAAAAGVAHHVTGFDLWLPNNGTGAFTLDIPGAATAAFVTVQEVDPAGQPVPPR